MVLFYFSETVYIMYTRVLDSANIVGRVTPFTPARSLIKDSKEIFYYPPRGGQRKNPGIGKAVTPI